MKKINRYFYRKLDFNDRFSPSIHWEHCLLLEKEMLDILQYIPIHDSMPNENWKVSSPKLIDIFTKSCFLFEAVLKAISNESTDRIIKYLKKNEYEWCKYFINGKNREGKSKDLNICDFLTYKRVDYDI